MHVKKYEFKYQNDVVSSNDMGSWWLYHPWFYCKTRTCRWWYARAYEQYSDSIYDYVEWLLCNHDDSTDNEGNHHNSYLEIANSASSGEGVQFTSISWYNDNMMTYLGGGSPYVEETSYVEIPHY